MRWRKPLGVVCVGLFVGCTQNTTDPNGENGSDAGLPANGPDNPGPSRPPLDCTGTQPGAAPLRLLTRLEYDLTLRDLVGDDTAPAQAFPPENNALGFENNAESHVVSPLLVQRYIDAAEGVAARAVTGRLQVLTDCRGADEPACGAAFISRFGRRAFRRPMHDEERRIFNDLFESVYAEEGFAVAIELVLAAMFQSPQFLYRIAEVAPNDAPGEVIALSSHEVASRLSYFLWSSSPDEALLDAADAGELVTAEQIELQARRMLADPKAKDTIESFHRQWLELDELEEAVKDIPAGTGGGLEHLKSTWIASLHAFVQHAYLESPDPVSALFNSRLVFLDEEVGALYGSAGLPSDVLTPVDLGPERSGLLTQPGLLAQLAHPDQTSPIRRGIFVREKLMCHELPPPPPDIVIEAPDPDPNATTRERFSQHTADSACAGCHALIDPIGFGFESFDALGRFRDSENGRPIDTRGEVIASSDPGLSGDFDNLVTLSAKLGQSTQVADCLAEQWFRYSMGRGPFATKEDLCSLRRMQDTLRGTRDFRELLVATTLTDAFRFRPGTAVVTAPPLPPDPEPPDAGVSFPDASEPAPDTGPSQIGPPAAPIGNVDSISEQGLVAGWALDPNTPDYPLYLEFFLDGPPGQGMRIHGFRADLVRPDVNQVTGHPGDHGFNEPLPRFVFDGQPHALYVVAFNSGNGPNPVLAGSPMTFTVGTLNRPPIGFIDVVTPNGVASGWTLDPDEPARSISVHFYLDGPAGSGRFLGATNADRPRPDVNTATGHPGDHGFNYTLPQEVRDGRSHRLFVYAIDTAMGRNPELTNSPMTFTVGGN